MSHDAKGNLLQVGDAAVIPVKVTAISTTEDGLYCNCEVELEYPMPPYKEKQKLSSINTQQLEKVQ